MMFLIFLALLAGGIAVAAVVLYVGYQAVFHITALHNPVFIPSADNQLEIMLNIAKIKPNAKLLDLGSGDGKVVIALAQHFPQSRIIGVELNPFLARSSRKAVSELRLSKQITIIQQSFWQTDLRPFDVVFLYGTSYIMEKLEKKVQQEMRPNTQFVSNTFQFPNLKPVKIKDQVRLYKL